MPLTILMHGDCTSYNGWIERMLDYRGVRLARLALRRDGVGGMRSGCPTVLLRPSSIHKQRKDLLLCTVKPR